MTRFAFKSTMLNTAFAVLSTTLAVSTATAQDIAPIKVEYSQIYPDGSRLATAPTEVRILKAEQMQKNVAGKVALGVLLFAIGGGTGFTSSSKDNMVGTSIEPLDDRSNIQTPKPDVFAARLQTVMTSTVKNDPELTAKTFEKPLLIAGGMTQLVYEGLTGPEAELYRLKSDWTVYKRKEGFVMLSNPNVVVDCSYQSPTAQSQVAWAENSYAQVKKEIEANLADCEEKVLAAAPALLKE